MLSVDEQEEVREQAYMGVPSNFKNVCFIRPLLVEEIIKMGRLKYQKYLGLLLLDEIEIAKIVKEKTKQEPKLSEIKVLEFLLQSAQQDDIFLLELQNAFSTFITEEVLLLPKINAIVVGPYEERRLITNDNFKEFQEILRIQNRKSVPEPPPENESAVAREFRLKREYRESVKRKQKAKDGNGQSFITLLEIAEVFGIDAKNKTLYALYELITRFQLKEKWDQDIAMLCAGADPQKIKTKYWGENSKE